MRSKAAVAAVLVSVVGLAGCAPAPAEPIPRGGGSALSALPAGDIGAGCSGVTYDYEPSLTPDELAAFSDVVVRGRVSGVRDSTDSDAVVVRSIVVRIDVTELVVGDNVGAAVGMSLVPPVGLAAEDCSAALPVGTAVVFFGAAAPGPSAISPDGVPLYIPSPQGFVAEAEEGQLVWPLIGVAQPGVLDDVLPAG